MSKYKYQDKWRKENTRVFKIRLSRNIDGDMIEFLESKENKQGYIKELIRADMIFNIRGIVAENIKNESIIYDAKQREDMKA